MMLSLTSCSCLPMLTYVTGTYSLTSIRHTVYTSFMIITLINFAYFKIKNPYTYDLQIRQLIRDSITLTLFASAEEKVMASPHLLSITIQDP